MNDLGGVVVQLLFTLIVFGAIVAIVTKTYADIVLAATLLAVIWQVVDLFRPSLFLATALILCFTGLWLVVSVAFTALGIDDTGSHVLIGLADEYLTDDQPAPTNREQRITRPEMDRSEHEDPTHDRRR